MAHQDDRPSTGPTPGAKPDGEAEEAEQQPRRGDEEAKRDAPAPGRRTKATEPGGSLKPERVQ